MLSWRNYTRGEVLSAKNTYRNPDTKPDKVYGWINYDITLQEWFQSLTELMSAKYNTALSDKQINQLVAKMTNIELVITDVGWGGAIQAVLREIMRLDGQRNKITGLYIGTHAADFCKTRPLRYVSYLMNNVFSKKYQPMWNAVIWEYAYTNKTQYPSDQAHLEQIAIGFQRGEELFRSIAGNPLYTFAKVTSPQLRRLVSHPTRKEAETIGNIYFDFKFVDEEFVPLVNTRWTTWQFWRMLIRHPRRTIHKVIFWQNSWPAAYFKYYHLGILKPAIWLWGKIRHRSYM